jgi:DNA-binding SARP family transcriptional activator
MKSKKVITLFSPSPHRFRHLSNLLSSQFEVWCNPPSIAEGIAGADLLLIHNKLPAAFRDELNLKREESGARVPILYIGERPETEEVIDAFRAGARDFILLPIDTELLLSRIERIFGECEKPGSPLKRLFARIKRYLKSDQSPVMGIVPDQVSGMPSARQLDASGEPDFVVNFFGNCAVFTRDESLEIKGRKANSILFYLLYENPKKVSREALIDRFWPYHSFEAGKNCLNVTIHTIRKGFKNIGVKKDVVVFENDFYFINPELSIETDCSGFELSWREGTRYEQSGNSQQAMNHYRKAFAYYRGVFAANLKSEEWSDMPREKFKERWLMLASRMCAYYFQEKKYSLVIDIARKILKVDSCMEEAHRYLMLCFSKMGHRSQAIRQYDYCRQRLWRELELLPELETEKLYQGLKSESSVQSSANTDHLP